MAPRVLNLGLDGGRWSPSHSDRINLGEIASLPIKWEDVCVCVCVCGEGGPQSQSRPGLANLFEAACPNCVEISMKFFHVPVGILKIKIRSWSFTQLLLITALLLIMHIIINS